MQNGLDKPQLGVSSGEYPPTPLLKLPPVGRFGAVYVKDESVHAGGTFKDRLARAAFSLYPEGTTFGAISYGNTAFSFSRLVAAHAAEGRRYYFVAFVPDKFSDWSLGPSTLGTVLAGKEILESLSKSSYVVPVDLSARTYDDVALRETAESAGVPVDRFVNVTEGVEVPAYVDIIKEAVAQLGRPPDVCIVQFGAGILCNEIRDHLQDLRCGEVVAISVPRFDSLARMLYGPIWVDATTLTRVGVAASRHASPDRTGRCRVSYNVHRVDEYQIEEGLRLAKCFGLTAEPSGTAGLGFLAYLPAVLRHRISDEATILVLNTGNGIDAIAATLGR